jgi:hypothetical protein
MVRGTLCQYFRTRTGTLTPANYLVAVSQPTDHRIHIKGYGWTDWRPFWIEQAGRDAIPRDAAVCVRSIVW